MGKRLRSYNRMELLEITLDAVVAHLRTDEPGLAWGVAWVDNGSSESNLPAMHQLRDKLQADTQHPLRTRWYVRLTRAPARAP